MHNLRKISLLAFNNNNNQIQHHVLLFPRSFQSLWFDFSAIFCFRSTSFDYLVAEKFVFWKYLDQMFTLGSLRKTLHNQEQSYKKKN